MIESSEPEAQQVCKSGLSGRGGSELQRPPGARAQRHGATEKLQVGACVISFTNQKEPREGGRKNKQLRGLCHAQKGNNKGRKDLWRRAGQRKTLRQSLGMDWLCKTQGSGWRKKPCPGPSGYPIYLQNFILLHLSQLSSCLVFLNLFLFYVPLQRGDREWSISGKSGHSPFLTTSVRQ